jgi:uncharacterized protein (AIM24 family)
MNPQHTEFIAALYQGGELLAKGNVLNAREHLERANALEPRNEKAQNLLGLAYFKLGLFERAASVYERLVRQNPADPTLRVNLGLVHLKTNHLQRAVQEFEAATAIDPQHAKAHNYLGLALAQNGDYARAKTHFAAAGSEVMADKMDKALAAQVLVDAAPRMAPKIVPPPTPIERPEAAAHWPVDDAEAEITFVDPNESAPTAETQGEAEPENLNHDWGAQFGFSTNSELSEAMTTSRDDDMRFAEDEGQSFLPPSIAAPPSIPPVGDQRDFDAFEAPPDIAPVDQQFMESLDATTSTGAESEAVLYSTPIDESHEVESHAASVVLPDDNLTSSSTQYEHAAAPEWNASTEENFNAAFGEAPTVDVNAPLIDAEVEAVDAVPELMVTNASPSRVSYSGPAPQFGVTQHDVASQFADAPVEPQAEDALPRVDRTDDSAAAASERSAALDDHASGWVAAPLASIALNENSPDLLSVAPEPSPSLKRSTDELPTFSTHSLVSNLTQSGYVPLPSQPLTQLSSETNHLTAGEHGPFFLGPDGLAIDVHHELLVRLHGLVAIVGSVEVKAEKRRMRGRATLESFGEGADQLQRVNGRGIVYLEAGKHNFHSLTLNDEGAYLREDCIFAFEETIAFENGTITGQLGFEIALVNLKGEGRALLKLGGALKSMPVAIERPTVVPLSRLVGWLGRMTPRLIGFAGQGAIELTGEGHVFLGTA